MIIMENLMWLCFCVGFTTFIEGGLSSPTTTGNIDSEVQLLTSKVDELCVELLAVDDINLKKLVTELRSMSEILEELNNKAEVHLKNMIIVSSEFIDDLQSLISTDPQKYVFMVTIVEEFRKYLQKVKGRLSMLRKKPIRKPAVDTKGIGVTRPEIDVDTADNPNQDVDDGNVDVTGFAVATRGRYGIDVETKDIGRTKPESDVDTAENEYQNMEDEDGAEHIVGTRQEMDVDSKIAETIPQIDVDTAEEQYQNVENEDGAMRVHHGIDFDTGDMGGTKPEIDVDTEEIAGTKPEIDVDTKNIAGTKPEADEDIVDDANQYMNEEEAWASFMAEAGNLKKRQNKHSSKMAEIMKSIPIHEDTLHTFEVRGRREIEDNPTIELAQNHSMRERNQKEEDSVTEATIREELHGDSENDSCRSKNLKMKDVNIIWSTKHQHTVEKTISSIPSTECDDKWKESPSNELDFKSETAHSQQNDVSACTVIHGLLTEEPDEETERKFDETGVQTKRRRKSSSKIMKRNLMDQKISSTSEEGFNENRKSKTDGKSGVGEKLHSVFQYVLSKLSLTFLLIAIVILILFHIKL